MIIKDIEEALKVGQVSPPELAQMKDFLAGTSSQLMDRQLQLELAYADFYQKYRFTVGSDKAVDMLWKTSVQGIEDMELENEQKKISILLRAISSHLRVSDLVARNLV